MARQLNALVEASRKPNVSLRVLTNASGEHAGMEGPFVILGFEEDVDPDVVYLEGMGGELYIEDIRQVGHCNVRFGRLCDQSLSEEDSVRLISEIAEEYRQSDGPSR
jgi:hypothetical protein